MEEKLRNIITAHNRMIETIEGAGITCNLFRGMEVWNKIACEGAEIVSAARSIGIGAKVDMQSGKISVTLMENNTRFTESEVLHAEHRTGLNRAEVLHILTEWDKGMGDADDVLDVWEGSAKILEPVDMPLPEIVSSLEDQALDKEDFVDEDDPDCIFRRDVAALRAAARLLRKIEVRNESI